MQVKGRIILIIKLVRKIVYSSYEKPATLQTYEPVKTSCSLSKINIFIKRNYLNINYNFNHCLIGRIC